MINSILLVLEGQSIDHGSVKLGVRWASNLDAMLVALGVLDESLVNPREPTPIGGGQAKRELDAARLHARQVQIESALSAIAVECAKAQVAFKPLETSGKLTDEILEEAQRFDLLMLPRFCEGDEGADKGIQSAFDAILRATPRPVIAAPTTLVEGDAVVVAYDGSVQAARTLWAFVGTGHAGKCPVHVITVHDDLVEAARRGNRAVEFLASHDIKAKLHTVAESNPAAQIMDLATNVNAGLLVMGAYGKSMVRDFFLGSVTRTIINQCTRPLFLYH